MSWEDTFKRWAAPPSATEQSKCDNAESMVKDAIRNDATLKNLNISVFAQGSYKANTNVRLDSDVDICVCCRSTIFDEYADGLNRTDSGITASSFTFIQFKQLVYNALVNKFGQNGISWGNKAFDVHANTYRVDADVVPTFEYRWYYRDSADALVYHEGVKLVPDKGIPIVNWPAQTYANGVQKNKDTGLRYKSVIRIVKRLRNEMQSKNISAAADIASFLIECLVWNSPNPKFGHSTLTDDVKEALSSVWFSTYDESRCSDWGEVNELKYLFRSAQPWTRQQAENFIWASRSYLGFV